MSRITSPPSEMLHGQARRYIRQPGSDAVKSLAELKKDESWDEQDPRRNPPNSFVGLGGAQSPKIFAVDLAFHYGLEYK